MSNDTKTTLLGFTKAALALIIAGLLHFTNIPVTSEVAQQISSSADWISLIIGLYGLVTGITGYYTNKPATTEQAKS